MPYIHRTQEETRRAILQIFVDEGRTLTRKEIVEGLGRTKSPHILDMIERLVGEGILTKSTITRHNGVTGYVYLLVQMPSEETKNA